MQTELPAFENCANCGAKQKADFKFCNKCGRRNVIKKQKEETADIEYRNSITFLATYSFSLILILFITSLIDTSFKVVVIGAVVLALLDLVFSYLQPSVWKLILPRKIKLAPLVSILAIGFSSGIVISYLIDNINFFLHEETYGYLPVFLETDRPLEYAIIVIAVLPAFFEELAFRGFVFNNIKNIAGSKSAIWGSAFLFGLVHLSLLSLFWIIPFGILLAYYRDKHNTLFYGILGHFTHNATVILLEYIAFLE